MNLLVDFNVSCLKVMSNSELKRNLPLTEHIKSLFSRTETDKKGTTACIQRESCAPESQNQAWSRFFSGRSRCWVRKIIRQEMLLNNALPNLKWVCKWQWNGVLHIGRCWLQQSVSMYKTGSLNSHFLQWKAFIHQVITQFALSTRSDKPQEALKRVGTVFSSLYFSDWQSTALCMFLHNYNDYFHSASVQLIKKT